MQVCSQPHAPVAISPVPIKPETGLAPERIWSFGEEITLIVTVGGSAQDVTLGTVTVGGSAQDVMQGTVTVGGSAQDVTLGTAEQSYNIVTAYYSCYKGGRRSQWPSGLRRRSAAAHLLELRVRIPPGS